MSIPLVLYHGGCWDGFCAAWVARKKLGEIEAVSVQYGQGPPDVASRDVYILDFSYPRMLMMAMIRYAKSAVVLDHHKTAKEDLEGLDDYCGATVRFDMNKSGGRLAWDYFFGDEYAKKFTPESCETIRPWLVDYTEDRDLWRHRLPFSKEINAALRSYPLDFDLWDRLNEKKVGPNNPWVSVGELESLVIEGTAILRAEKQIVDTHVGHAREIDLDGHKILAVNATVLFSEIAGKLAEGRPFGAAWFQRADGKRQWSLRSKENGVDVSEVAKRHGGGGHKNAAGFEEGK